MPSWARRALALVAIACAGAPACSILTSFDGLTGGGTPPNAADGSVPDGPGSLDGQSFGDGPHPCKFDDPSSRFDQGCYFVP